MNYILYAVLIAVILGIIALVDKLLKALFRPSATLQKSVRQPRYTPVLGVLFSMLGVVCLLWIPPAEETLLWCGGLLALVIGLYLLISFQRFAVLYDEEGFTFRTMTRQSKTYRYEDITGQRSFLARSGLNTTLYAKGDEIPLNGSMQGVTEFLHTAFRGWCRARGLDPETVQTDPATLTYFPEQES